jgi:hypothetical protein
MVPHVSIESTWYCSASFMGYALFLDTMLTAIDYEKLLRRYTKHLQYI